MRTGKDVRTVRRNTAGGWLINQQINVFKIAFLFVHEQAHQIPHAAPILDRLCQLAPENEFFAFVSSATNAETLKRLLSPETRSRVSINIVSSPKWASFLEAVTGGAAPLRRIGMLSRLSDQLADMDMIVTPETTSIMLKTKFGITKPKLVFTQHGAGDRAVGFKPKIALFDHVLIPGEKIQTRMRAQGIVTETGHSVVGYPKFECFQNKSSTNARLFPNANPIIVYNPHFDPHLSSWYRHGEEVLEIFAKQDAYNLIFAPHVMVFSRTFHITSDLKHVRWRGRIGQYFKDCPNIHIDTGSDASIDMSYTRAADVYLGDASSQVYEFIQTPRPCIFLNSNAHAWQNNSDFAHWTLGPVIRQPGEIIPLLDQRETAFETYKPVQAAAFEKTFDEDAINGATRAAKALLGVLSAHATPS